MDKPYKISEPVQVYALNITTTCECDKCPPEYKEYIVEENGEYYVKLNGVIQANELLCMQGDIIQMYITHNKVISDIKRPDKKLDEYNKEYLNNYYFVLEESKSLSKIQHGIYLLIHFLFLIIVPIILMEEFIKDPIISLIVFIMYMFCSNYISLFIQKYITNKIFKLIYNGR